eukprot:TRINITY_DN7129_c0_g3_i2.p1 TRINITY_DN7129_c0_g3~~TRINITY_DN7129_c0_g3_i2.p1  ORF type:complete len:472 (+),score=119.68 TRINITY_DN7129_c0_g3_i2:136-1551(+)
MAVAAQVQQAATQQRLAAATAAAQAAALAAVQPPPNTCLLCKRRFKGPEALLHHQQHSELHRSNTEREEELALQHKNEVLSHIHALRQQLHEATSSRKTVPGLCNREQLETKLRQLLGEYGQAQEMLEFSLRPKGGGVPASSPPAARANKPSRSSARIGRLSLEAGAAMWRGDKEVQEDRYLIDIELRSAEGYPVVGFCVMDGHSGSRCADYLVERLAPCLQACLASKPCLSDATLQQAVTEACALADGEFLAAARAQTAMDGSTMVLALIYPEVSPAAKRPPGACKLLISNVGDSRAVLCRAVPTGGAGGSSLVALRLSDDHKPNRPDEQRRIRERGGVTDFHGVWRVFLPSPVTFGTRAIPRWGLAVSRAFGDLLLKEPERYGCEAVQPGGLVTSEPEHRLVELNPAESRFLVLACDGVWDVLPDSDAVAVCAAQAGPELAAHALVRHSFAAGSSDNLTAVVISWRDLD